MMKYLSALAAAVVVAATTTVVNGQGTAPLEIGVNACVTGYVMDFFCIDRGTLLDDPATVSLSAVGPSAHSIHCLVDVNSCRTSEYEVLLPPDDANPSFTRGFRLTEEAKQSTIALARAIGECSTCDGTGSQVRGFQAAFNAEVIDLGDGESIPPTISITGDVVDATASSDPCGDIGLPNILDTYAVVGLSGDTGLNAKIYAHGTLMMIGWGLLLPCGVLIAKFFKHRPNGLWFKIHRPLQIFGLIVALTGWIIALTSFNVFGDKGYTNYYHGIMGCTVMSLGLCQPINAFLRPHAPEAGDDKPLKRLAWEILHKTFGWGAVLLAVATIGIGTTLLPNVDDRKRYQYAYGIGCGCILLLLMVGIFYDKYSYSKVESEEKEEPERAQAEEQPEN